MKRSMKTMTKKTMIKTTTPKKDVIFTAIEFYDAKFGNGWDYLTLQYYEQLEKSDNWTQDELIEYFTHIIWPKIMIYRKYSDPILYMTEDELEEDYIEDIYLSWLSMSKLDECVLKDKSRCDIYCTLSIRTNRNSSMGIPLYQIPSRIDEMDQNGRLSNWQKRFVASHLCHTKQCMVCAIKEPRQKNLHRNYCVAFSLIDNILFHSCNHEPKCRDFGSLAFFEE
jgi:hypothetical protein